jgi:hypothetical protein
VNQLKIGGFILEIDGDRAVFPRLFGSLSHVSPQVIRSRMLMRHDGGKRIERSRQLGWAHGGTTKCDGMWSRLPPQLFQ